MHAGDFTNILRDAWVRRACAKFLPLSLSVHSRGDGGGGGGASPALTLVSLVCPWLVYLRYNNRARRVEDSVSSLIHSGGGGGGGARVRARLL